MPSPAKESGRAECEEDGQVQNDVLQRHAESIIRRLIGEASDFVVQEKMQREEVVYTVRDSLKGLRQLIRLEFASPGDFPAATTLGSWNLNLEEPPPPCSVDTWARSAIPIIKRPKSKELESGLPSMKEKTAGSKATKSVASRSRRASRASATSATRRAKQAAPDYLVDLSKLDEEQDLRLDGFNRGACQHRRSEKSKKLVAAQRQLEEKANQERAAMERRRAEEDEKSRRAEVLSKELDGKLFALDGEGEIVLVKPLDGDKLPSGPCVLPHNIRGTESHIPPQEFLEKLLHPGTPKTSEEKATQEPKVNDGCYSTIPSFQQCILKNPSLEVQPGVCIRDGQSSAVGPQQTRESNRMSKENFEAHQLHLEMLSQLGAAHDAAASHESVPDGSPIGNVPRDMGAMEGSCTHLDGAVDGFHEKEQTRTQGLLKKGTGSEKGEPFQDEDVNLRLIREPSWGQKRPEKIYIPGLLPSAKGSIKSLPADRRTRQEVNSSHAPLSLAKSMSLCDLKEPTVDTCSRHGSGTNEPSQHGAVLRQSRRAEEVLGLGLARSGLDKNR